MKCKTCESEFKSLHKPDSTDQFDDVEGYCNKCVQNVVVDCGSEFYKVVPKLRTVAKKRTPKKKKVTAKK